MRACSVGEREGGEIRHKQTEEMFSRLSRPSHSFPLLLLLQVFIVLGGGKERTRLHFFPSPPSLPGHGKRGGGEKKWKACRGRKEGVFFLINCVSERRKKEKRGGMRVCVWARLSLGSGEKSGTGSHLRETNPLQGGGEERELPPLLFLVYHPNRGKNQPMLQIILPSFFPTQPPIF